MVLQFYTVAVAWGHFSRGGMLSGALIWRGPFTLEEQKRQVWADGRTNRKADSPIPTVLPPADGELQVAERDSPACLSRLCVQTHCDFSTSSMPSGRHTLRVSGSRKATEPQHTATPQ